MLNWNKAQWDAFGRHVLTAVGSAITVLVVVNLVDAKQATVFLDHTSTFINAMIGLITVLAPVYAAYRAASSASPTNQAVQTVKNLNAGTPLNGERAKLIAAVAEQPEVAKVVVKDPITAIEVPSVKVVAE